MKKTLTTLLFVLIPTLALALGEVNINTANKQEMLDNLEGLSPEQADAIIEHRTKNGPFVNVHEVGTLDEVGWDVLNINQGRINVGDSNWGDRKS
ncbi:MAG TPA: helix-hairpin-helix domain-containing protein [Gammaproteobacteria bacterium]|nr:helix-hairpin-helix domain-containing protein [Gammaproteobacteria bacterium]